MQLARDKLATLDSAMHAGILRGARSFGIRAVKTQADEDGNAVAKLVLGPTEAAQRARLASAEMCEVLHLPAEVLDEDLSDTPQQRIS